MVIGSRIIARVFFSAHCRVATDTAASCSSVVPYFFMCCATGTENIVGGPATPNGASNCPPGVARPALPPPTPTRDRPDSP